MTGIDVWYSSRPKPGRRFEPTHELALHDLAAELSLGLRGASKGLVLVRELLGPIGIPDLTALVGEQTRLDKRLSLDVPPLINEIDAAIVSAAYPHTPRSLSAMGRALGWPEETIARRIPGLLRSGALERSGDRTYTRPEALTPIGQLVAIEAKLKDWRGALTQARGYSVWADNYVLVMGKLTTKIVENLRAEVQADLGGLVVDGTWVVRPRKRTINAARRVWASEHFVAALTDPATSPRPARSH